MYVCFIVNEKTFDRVWYVGLMKILRNARVIGKEYRWMKNLCWAQKTCIRVGEEKNKFQVSEKRCQTYICLVLRFVLIIRENK